MSFRGLIKAVDIAVTFLSGVVTAVTGIAIGATNLHLWGIGDVPIGFVGDLPHEALGIVVFATGAYAVEMAWRRLWRLWTVRRPVEVEA